MERALQRAQPGSRNETAFWLACQLRDAGLASSEAEPVLVAFAFRAPAGDHPFTVREALAGLRSAYSQPARERARLTATLGNDGYVMGTLALNPEEQRVELDQVQSALGRA